MFFGVLNSEMKFVFIIDNRYSVKNAILTSNLKTEILGFFALNLLQVRSLSIFFSEIFIAKTWNFYEESKTW